jgi:nucleoside-diphosphate-sugar epimerase
MKNVIITGGAGFLGAKLSETLSNSGYEVLALGRKNYNDINEFRLKQLKNVIYKSCDLSIDSLDEILANIDWKNKKIDALFHIAWSGKEGLSDLNVQKQFENLSTTLKLFDSAEKLKIEKFLFTGTMEEFFAEKYLGLDFKKDTVYNRHVIYALSKLWTKKALKKRAFYSKTDVIFLTNSHIIGPGDEKDSFLQVSLSKMIHNQPIVMSSGVQLFDVIDVIDCADTYKAVLENGKRLNTYIAGSGNPQILKNYIFEMKKLFSNYKGLTINSNNSADIVLSKENFDTSLLVNDTNFTPNVSFQESIVRLKDYLIKYDIRYP